MSHRIRKCPMGERGVSEVVGVILILGMLVATFSAFYPIWRQNEIYRLEAERMEWTKNGFLELKSKIEGLSPGDSTSVNLKLGRNLIAFGPDFQVTPNLSGAPAVLKTVKIYPDHDGYISENLPDTTFGADLSLQVASTEDNIRRAFLKFPVENIPSRAMILKATLWLYSEEAERPMSGVTDIRCYSVENDAWSEESLNWENQPSMVKALDSLYVDGSGWISLTVKDFVAQEIMGDKTISLGLKMKLENYDSAERYVSFSSAETDDRSPYLEIMYAEGTEVPLDVSYKYVGYEYSHEGATTGISGAQADDGNYENIYEINYGGEPSGTTMGSPSSTSGGWTNPTNAYADGGGYASVTSGTPSASQTYSGYVFDIPSGSTITSVKVRYDAWDGISFIGYTSSTANNPVWGTFTLPAGWVPGDVAIFWWYTRSSNKTFNPPSGVTQKQLRAVRGYGRIYIGYRTLLSGDTTFAWTSSGVRDSTTIWGVSVFRGVDGTGDPFEAESGAPATFTNVNDPDPPAVTTLSNDACVITIFGKNNDYTSIAPPTNYTTAGSDSSVAGNNASAGAAYRVIASPGTEDPGAWTLGGGGPGDDGYVWTGALKPDPADSIRVDVSWDGGTSWSSKQVTTLSGTETTYWYDVTGATSWTPEKLSAANFRVRVDAYTVGRAGEVRLDWIPVEVTYGLPKYRLDVEHRITGVSVAEEYQLQIKYYIAGDSEKVMLYLYDHSDGSWDHIENLSNHDASNPDIFTYVLTGTNYLSASREVRVRYVQQDNDGFQTSVMVDYCRVEAKTVTCQYVTDEQVTEGGTINFNNAKADDGNYENIYEINYGAPISEIRGSPSSTSGGWTNPTYAYADGGGYASVTTNLASQTYGGYGFNIPPGSFITSVRVRYDAWATISGITFVGAGREAEGTGNVTPELPTGWQQNDIFLLFCETANEAVTAPAGWTEVAGSPQGTGTAGGTASTRLTVFWRRATASETAPTVADPGDHICAGILAFRGVVTTGDPWDVTAGDVASTASTSVTIPGAATSVDGCMVVVAVANSTDSNAMQTSGWTNANLTGLTERVDYNTNSGNGGGFGVATGVKSTAGNYGSTTATLSISSVQGRMSIALKPNTTMPKIRVDVSWDGGTSWSTYQETDLTTGETTYWYDITGATSWTPEKLNNTNFRVRATAVTAGTVSQVNLDWIPVEVTYGPAYRMDVEHHITDIPSADRYDLQIKYYTTGDLEPVSLLLYNWTSGEWNTIGNLEVGGSASVPHIFTCTLESYYVADGAVRVRYVQQDNDGFQTSVMVDYCRVETMTTGVVDLSPFGGVEFIARNDFYPSQTYVYEAGALILVQGDTNLMVSEPALLSISEVGANLRVEVNLWVIENRGDSIASTGTATIRATCKPTSGYAVTPVDANAPNRENVTILIPTKYINAWSKYLEDLCAGLPKNYNADWRYDPKSGGLKLVIYGNTKESGVNDIIYYEKLNELEITIS